MTLHKAAGRVFVAVTLLATSALMARQSVLLNGSVESGPGQGGVNPFIVADWVEFGTNVERSPEANLLPAGAGYALKSFGDPVGTSAGAYQDAVATSGHQVSVSASLYTRSTDKLGGGGQAGLRVEFRGQFGQLLSYDEVLVLDSSSTADTWTPVSLGPLTAPASTTSTRLLCILKWPLINISTGSVYWDDAQLSINAGPDVILNGDFETAGVSTEPNPAGIDDWTGFEDQQKSADAAYHGAYSLKIGTQKAYSGLWQDMTDLSDGDHILLVARAMMLSSDPPDGTSRSGIKLEFETTTAVPEENMAFDENSPADTWQQVTLSTTVPAEMTIARIVCLWSGNPLSTGSVHFDSVWVEINTSGVNELMNLNPSFELGDGGANGLDFWTEFLDEGVSQAQKSCGGFTTNGDCTMKATGENFAGVWQEINVTPGHRLDISAGLYTESIDKLTGTALAGVKVEWFAGGVPGDIDFCAAGQNNCLEPGDPQDVWGEMTIDYTMPPGTAAVARFTNLVEKGTATGGAYYFDACEAVVVNRFNGADSDADFDADLLDLARFQRCFTGPGGAREWGCLVFDSDDDGDIELDDFDFFEQGLTGPVVP